MRLRQRLASEALRLSSTMLGMQPRKQDTIVASLASTPLAIEKSHRVIWGSDSEAVGEYDHRCSTYTLNVTDGSLASGR